jgi:hypothetical protein
VVLSTIWIIYLQPLHAVVVEQQHQETSSLPTPQEQTFQEHITDTGGKMASM